ncbi:hypothetical protein V1477_011244 [Vespula maculifrons]|uniref:Uncharacterized protein n=1 Tax=Vespula maculifrons TaxID=7453 RepID=A0ABD2C4T5_VESMC
MYYLDVSFFAYFLLVSRYVVLEEINFEKFRTHRLFEHRNWSCILKEKHITSSEAIVWRRRSQVCDRHIKVQHLGTFVLTALFELVKFSTDRGRSVRVTSVLRYVGGPVTSAVISPPLLRVGSPD